MYSSALMLVIVGVPSALERSSAFKQRVAVLSGAYFSLGVPVCADRVELLTAGHQDCGSSARAIHLSSGISSGVDVCV